MIYNDKISEKFHQMDNKILGNSNYEECVLDVRKILDVKQKCQIGTDYCSFHDVFISDVKSSKFMAVSGFWYNLKNTNKLLNASFGHNLTSFREATKLVCSYSWDQVILHFSLISISFIPTYWALSWWFFGFKQIFEKMLI